MAAVWKKELAAATIVIAATDVPCITVVGKVVAESFERPHHPDRCSRCAATATRPSCWSCSKYLTRLTASACVGG